MNIIHLLGNVGSEPVARRTPNNQKVTNFTIAVNSRRGENQITTWYKIVVWGEKYDKMLPYIKKGTPLIIIGDLQPPEIYKDKENHQHIKLEVYADIVKFAPSNKAETAKSISANPTPQQESLKGGGNQTYEEERLPF